MTYFTPGILPYTLRACCAVQKRSGRFCHMVALNPTPQTPLPLPAILAPSLGFYTPDSWTTDILPIYLPIVYGFLSDYDGYIQTSRLIFTGQGSHLREIDKARLIKKHR